MAAVKAAAEAAASLMGSNFSLAQGPSSAAGDSNYKESIRLPEVRKGILLTCLNAYFHVAVSLLLRGFHKYHRRGQQTGSVERVSSAYLPWNLGAR